MTSKSSRNFILATTVIILVIVVDQLIKVWVKTHFYLGEDMRIFNWMHLVFVENNGMAFGLELGTKLFLTLFRIVAVGFLGWFLWRLCRRGASAGLVGCLALVTAGAAGNIFDCVFYGMIFNNPYPPAVAEFVEFGSGYAPLFYGKVVDMFYFPLFSFTWPGWMPVGGGEEFLFFQPVFNFADAAISVGVIALLLYYNRFLTGGVSEAGGRESQIAEQQ